MRNGFTKFFNREKLFGFQYVHICYIAMRDEKKIRDHSYLTVLTDLYFIENYY